MGNGVQPDAVEPPKGSGAFTQTQNPKAQRVLCVSGLFSGGDAGSGSAGSGDAGSGSAGSGSAGGARCGKKRQTE